MRWRRAWPQLQLQACWCEEVLVVAAKIESEIAEFESYAKDFIEKLNEDKSIMMAYTSFNSSYPQYYVDINRDKVSACNGVGYELVQ